MNKQTAIITLAIFCTALFLISGTSAAAQPPAKKPLKRHVKKERFDPDRQDAYLKLRALGVLKTDPDIAAKIQVLIKRGVLHDLSQPTIKKQPFDPRGQELYAKLRARGVLKNDPDAAAAVAELIKRGVLHDLSQPTVKKQPFDQKLQSWYAEGWAHGWVQSDPKLTAQIAKLVKDGTLHDLSGGKSSALPSELPTPPSSTQPIVTRRRMTTEEIVAATMPSVVTIFAKDSSGATIAQGSGFVIARNIVATNWHVISSADSATARFSSADNATARFADGRSERIFGYLTDYKSDLATLLVRTGSASPLPLADTSNLPIGSNVVAIGSPEGLSGTVSTGIVSGIRLQDGLKVIQTSAPISHGSSGGPLLNEFGEVIGLTSFMVKSGQNLNFAYPAYYLTQSAFNWVDGFSGWGFGDLDGLPVRVSTPDTYRATNITVTPIVSIDFRRADAQGGDVPLGDECQSELKTIRYSLLAANVTPRDTIEQKQLPFTPGALSIDARSDLDVKAILKDPSNGTVSYRYRVSLRYRDWHDVDGTIWCDFASGRTASSADIDSEIAKATDTLLSHFIASIGKVTAP